MSSSHFSRSSEAESAAAPVSGRRWPVWPWVVLLVVAAMLAAYQFSGSSGRNDAGENHPGVGTRIAKLRLEPLTGGGSPVTVADLQGKVTLINFWGPYWCPPCLEEFPHLVEIEQHFRGNKRFQFLSISCSGGPGSGEEIGPLTAQFLEEHRAKFPTYRDPYQRFAQHLEQVAKLDGFVFPTSLVVDQRGVIRGLWAGYLPGDERQMHALLERTLREAL
jgi:cytochrome c biogenesis protein CcmG, thiol:disulfide interchange protein DsbE